MSSITGKARAASLFLELSGRALAEIGALVLVFGPLDAEMQKASDLVAIVKISAVIGLGLIGIGILIERLGRKWLDEDEAAWKGRLIAKLVYGSAAVLETDPADRGKVIRAIGHRIVSE